MTTRLSTTRSIRYPTSGLRRQLVEQPGLLLQSLGFRVRVRGRPGRRFGEVQGPERNELSLRHLLRHRLFGLRGLRAIVRPWPCHTDSTFALCSSVISVVKNALCFSLGSTHRGGRQNRGNLRLDLRPYRRPRIFRIQLGQFAQQFFRALVARHGNGHRNLDDFITAGAFPGG